MIGNLVVLVAAYLLGSLPTALIVSRAVAGVDIREIGDGNMGARNVTRTLGWGPGIVVASADFSKGALAVTLAQATRMPVEWQLAAGLCAVLGHDFPIFAGFRGGQGMAAILGMLFIFMPVETAYGLAGFGTAYIVTRNFDLSAGIGLGLLAYLGWYFDEEKALVGYAVILFLSIPAKKALDWPRRIRLKRKALDEANAEEAQPTQIFKNGE